MDTIVSYAEDVSKFQKTIIFNAGFESSVDYAEPSSIYVPKVNLLFSPFGLPFIPLEILGSNVGSIITSLAWTKDRNNPGGVLAINVVPTVNTIKEIFHIMEMIPGGSLYTKIWNEMGYDLEDLFKPMTLCQLWIDGYHVMTGTVRGCRRTAGVENDGYSVSYSITMDELGYIYTKSTLSLETIIASDGMHSNLADSMTSAFETTANIKGVTVAEGINMLVSAFVASTLLNQGMSMSDGFPLAMRLLSTPWPIGGMSQLSFAQNMFVNSNMFEMSQQSFWDFLKNFIPSPWQEFFTESGGRTIVTDFTGVPAVLFPGFNYIVSRSTPYSNPLIGVPNLTHWISLLPFDLSAISMLLGGDFVIITDDDIIEKDIGFDGSNQATAFRTKYTSGSGNKPTGICDKPIVTYGPLNPLASGGVGTFGLVEMQEVINCTSLYDRGAEFDTVIADVAEGKISAPGILSKQAFSNLLAVWFRNQSRFREGSVTVKCKAWARAGMYCLYLPTLSGKKPENIRDIGIYYIDSIAHHYGLTNTSVSATTELKLIRGVPLPTTLAKSALLLFDYEILPPMSGLWDGEGKTMQAIRRAVMKI